MISILNVDIDKQRKLINAINHVRENKGKPFYLCDLAERFDVKEEELQLFLSKL